MQQNELYIPDGPSILFSNKHQRETFRIKMMVPIGRVCCLFVHTGNHLL